MFCCQNTVFIASSLINREVFLSKDFEMQLNLTICYTNYHYLHLIGDQNTTHSLNDSDIKSRSAVRYTLNNNNLKMYCTFGLLLFFCKVNT